MRSPKKSPRSVSDLRSRSQKTAEKLQSFRPLPYHIALSKAADLEAWTQDVETLRGPTEATDSSDFDPRLMERTVPES